MISDFAPSTSIQRYFTRQSIVFGICLTWRLLELPVGHTSASESKLPASARLKDKVILVTGSTTGIGEGMVRIFAREGARVMFHGRRRD
ncbi:hypothetical protein SBA5_590056 [Candidatus Sulfotelmatomonas gaucii]|uniref:Uncharacterized protein n=1 Tax=Candidatus Sulfuritelmatomonas gaucii TaxID=2043161 RepID=A0A2N9LVV1_9BACT|nr:hypothetical protein SBA5_590056 [Candidatus Sulfotelmatomonas gaucii]